MLSFNGQGLLLLAEVSSRIARAFEGAAPRRFQPMYAWANMGHPSREEGFVLRSHHCDADELQEGYQPTWFADARLQL